MSTTKVIKGYRLNKPLATGGMGSVYVAEKLATHQPFAVKFMQDHLVADPSYVIRFEREISALRAIRHPNVVDVFEWNLPQPGANEPPFVVMELLDGEGLDRLLKRRPILPLGMAVEIVLQVLDGLAAAHAVGVIHRDLGPSNVFLEPQPGGKFRAKILDFGLARPMDEEGAGNVTQAGTLMGKPAYVAPEQFVGTALDARGDLFACGIILYRMLTGRFPYRETDPQMLWVERYSERDQGKEYPSPQTHNGAIPDSLDAVVAKAIRLKPDQRFLSAREMQQALLAVEADIQDDAETVLVEPASTPRLVPEIGSSTVMGRSAASVSLQPAPRRWLPVVVAAGIIAAAVVAAVVILFGGRDGAHRAAAAAPPSAAAVPAQPAPSTPAAPAAKTIHLTVLGAPPEAIVNVGSVALAGDPPQGDVPWSTDAVDIVVAAQGFQIYRDTIVPDRHKSVRVALAPIPPPAAADAGGATAPSADAAAASADAGSAVAVVPPERDAGHVGLRDVRVGPTRDAGAVVVAHDAGVAAPRDAGPAVAAHDAGGPAALDVAGAGHLPDDPFAVSHHPPQDARP